jgi:hypothetical protein|tara:strand:- start:746 stop:2161 length:1416 start_codon:yes stop_codon:yes gene_type:complete
MIQNNKSALLIIFIGFIISILFTTNNLDKYDKNLKRDNGNSYHQMIKNDAHRYLSHGIEIKDQLKDGVNFFETGREHYTKYLPARIYAAYYYFFDLDPVNNLNEGEIKTGIHFPYLVMQSLLYYFSVILLYFSISKKINTKISFFVVSFLCFEPTILQYHSSFWSESVFFSLQILLISLILKNNQSNLNFFFIGVFLTILSFQKEYSIFYIIPVMFYYLLTTNNLKYRKFFFLVIGFFLIQSILGYNNYKRSGQFYIMTADSKINLHGDLVGRVITKKFNLTGLGFKSMEGEVALKWIQKNKIELNKAWIENIKEPGYTDYRSAISEKDRLKFDEFIKSRTLDYFSKYPLDFIKYAAKNSLHVILLNPFHIYSDNNFVSGEKYYSSKKHAQFIPYRITYSISIYIICLYGLYTMIKRKEYNILFYLTLSIVYFYGLVSWHGNTRYFVPVMIYLAFFFAFGLDKILTLKKNT